jgi:hypothetical protein
MKKLIILFCFFLLCKNSLNAQVALVNPHPFFFQSADVFYIGGSLESLEDKALGGDVGVVINRAVNIGVGIGKIITNDELAQQFDASTYHISPHISFFTVSQNDLFPLSVGITGGLSHIKVNAPIFDALGVTSSGRDLTFQLNSFTSTEVSPTTLFVVGGSVVYLSRKITAKDNVGNIYEQSANEVGFNVHGGLKINGSPSSYFYLNSKLTFIFDEISFLLTAGFGFGKHKASRQTKANQQNYDLDDLLNKEEFTRLPNFRAIVPGAKKYTDSEILAMFREKYPNLKNRTDEELIRLIENKYGEKK